MLQGEIDAGCQPCRSHFQAADLHGEAGVRKWIVVEKDAADVSERLGEASADHNDEIGPCAIVQSQVDLCNKTG